MATIAQVMVSAPVTVDFDESVSAVCRRMAHDGIGAALVARGGELVGIFSERDVVTRVVAHGVDPGSVTVGEVASAQLVTVTPETPIREAAQLLRDRAIRHLPVVEGGRAVGIVSSRDFFAYVASGLERIIDQRMYEAALEDGADPFDHLGAGYGR